MSWSHSRVAADSGSDLEQPEEALPLMTRKQGVSARLGLCAGLLVAAVGLVGLVPQAPHLLGAVHLPMTRKTATLSGTMQAFAVERLGRTLSDSEIEKLYSHVSSGGHPRARALMDRFAMEEEGEQDSKASHNQAFKLSQVCVDAIHVKMKHAFKRFALLLIEAFFGCVLGDESSGACTVATNKMDHFLEDLVETCVGEDDFCNITAIGKKGSKLVVDSTAVCVPTVCHAEAEKAIAYFKEQLGEQIAKEEAQSPMPTVGSGALQPKAELDDASDCANCTVNIACGAAQTPVAQTPAAGRAEAEKESESTVGHTVVVKDAEQLEDAEHFRK